MTEKLIWTATVRIESGPQLTGNDDMPVDSYTKVSELVAKDNDLTVDVGTDDDGKVACCLVIVPDRPSTQLTYEVDGKSIALDQPQFLFGGALKLVGDQVKIHNGDAEPISVKVLVGRQGPPVAKEAPGKGPGPAKKAAAKKAEEKEPHP